MDTDSKIPPLDQASIVGASMGRTEEDQPGAATRSEIRDRLLKDVIGPKRKTGYGTFFETECAVVPRVGKKKEGD